MLNMKKWIIFVLLSVLFPLSISAQSSMTDEQVISFILKENEAGTSQQQIVTKLVQRGVDINQIRRVKNKYQRQINQSGLGVAADKAVTEAENRLRKNNAKKDEGENFMLEGERTRALTEDEKQENLLLMQSELSGTFFPTDTLELLTMLQNEREKNRKKVFGRDIFNNENLSFEPNMNIATPQNYVLGPGDAVNIDIYGASQKSINETISPDGDVVIEGIGPVQLAGLSVSAANARLRSVLGPRYSSSRVKLTVGQTKTVIVNVLGEVTTPGTYTLSAFSTAFNALYMAGGISDIGTLRNIKVYRGGKLLSVVDVYDYILNGNLKGNVRLVDNDVIVVDPYDCLVNVVGKVKRPMFYEMKANESLNSLMKYSGGFTGDAYKKSVKVTRKNGRSISVFDVDEFDMASFRLADGDSVTVDSTLLRYENTVEVRGAVFRPDKYQMGGDITTVRSLIEHADGVTEQAFMARAVMHRMKPDRTLKVISLDLAGILNGTVPDVPLENEDVVFVPTKQEVQEERTITIHGEVMYPGTYVYADDETLEDFVLQAGGLKETASVMKVDVSRRVTNPKALDIDSLISRVYTFALKDGFVIDGEPGFTLMPYDEVYIRKSPGFSRQQNITVEGQVMFAGTYTLTTKNEKLSEVIKRAGGVTDLAYVAGARLERRITADERRRMQTVLKMVRTQDNGKDSVDVSKLDLGDTYYVGIELDKAIANPGSDADLVLREGDRVIVPEYNGTVKISGDVMFPNTVSYEKGKRAKYYIDQAGGWGDRAKKRNTYIIYMNGTVAQVGHNAKIRPGCEIVVPSKPKTAGMKVTEWLTLGTSVASIATMMATLANILK
jgi:protein involved in polysaccharide export with SLBB domain